MTQMTKENEAAKTEENMKNDSLACKAQMDEIENFLVKSNIPYKREQGFSDVTLYDEILTFYDAEGRRQGDITYGSGITGYGDAPFMIRGQASHDLSDDRTENGLSASDAIERLYHFYEVQKINLFTDERSYKTAKEGMDRMEAWAKENGVLFRRTGNADHTSGTFIIYDQEGKYAGDAIYGWFAYGDSERPFEVSEGLSENIDDVEGHLTADEVIERFAKQIKKERNPKVEEAYEAIQKADIDSLTVNPPEFVHGDWQFTLITERNKEMIYDGKGELWLWQDPYTLTRLKDIDPEELSALGDPDIFRVRFTLEEKEQGLSGSEREATTDDARPFVTPERDEERGPEEEDEEELA